MPTPNPNALPHAVGAVLGVPPLSSLIPPPPP